MSSVTKAINIHVNGWALELRQHLGMSETVAMIALTVCMIVVGLLLVFIVRPIVLLILGKLADRPRSVWLKAAYKNHVFHRITWLIPGLVALLAVPIVQSTKFEMAPVFAYIFQEGAEVYLVGVVAAVLSALLNTIQTRFQAYSISQKYSIKSYIQVLKIILFCLTIIVMVSVLMNQSPMYLLTGLGAMTAVGMLVFKDSILGFVASIQLSAYDMIRVGDWIVMSKYGADGTVLDISLNTIKVQNFDKTIVTIPSYTILTEGVKNWRGMSESGGRRIKRYITININSMKLCQADLIAKLCKLPLLKERLDKYLKNQQRHVDTDAMNLMGVDARCLSNFTLYRLYLEAYLSSHPSVKTDFSFLVRELQDTTYGLPLEVYLFVNTTDWSTYESIQSDIFDYIYSVLPLFELEAYQYESETRKGFETGAA